MKFFFLATAQLDPVVNSITPLFDSIEAAVPVTIAASIALVAIVWGGPKIIRVFKSYSK